MTDILNNLPWQIQVSLASGYAAYLLAYRGIREGHRPIDTTFITLVFGLIATAVVTVLPAALTSFRVSLPVTLPQVIAGGVAFIVTCFVAILWRRFFRHWLHLALHVMKVSWSNDDPSALATLSGNTRFPVSQIAVELDNGTWLRCDDASRFADAPFGPFVIGPSGEVAIYLTHRETADAADLEVHHVRDAYWGDRITYVPASRVRQITLRHKC